MKEALYWTRLDKAANSARCALCPHNCAIPNDRAGLCGARKNISGKLYSLSYGGLTSVNLDPIEKKPLYHFYPGANILSVGSFGCNFKCSFCQNWEISQSGAGEIPVKHYEPSEIAEMASECGSVGVAYTYNEPLMNYEWVKETSKAASDKGLKNVLVTNGYISPEPLAALLEHISAANVDVKSFSEVFYKKFCGGSLRPVLDTVEALVKAEKHVEVTTLLIPGENDSPEEISKLASWLAVLSTDIPFHLSRYFPAYKMKNDPTDISSLERAWSAARAHLKYVYIGNISLKEYSSTVCPACGEVLIERQGYDIKMKSFAGGSCGKCKGKVNIEMNK